MASQYFGGNFTHVTSHACIVDSTPPTFSGINYLDVESRGQIRAGWPAATEYVSLPVRHEVYIQANTNVGLFNPVNIVAVTPNLTYDIFTLPNGAFLVNGTTYYVGVRAIDGVSNRDSNTANLSVISTGILTSIDVYETHAAWSIDSNNDFQVTLWADKNESLAGGVNGVLGTASYQVYDKTGAAVAGMTETGLVKNAQNVYIGSGVVSTLSSPLNHYTLKVTISVDGEDRVNFIPLEAATAEYSVDGLFLVDHDNQLKGNYWVTKSGQQLTTGLGTASYQIYDSNGAIVSGMSQAAMTADVNGRYILTPLPSTLPRDYSGFSAKITFSVEGKVYNQIIKVNRKINELKPKAQFSINALNNLQATFWIEDSDAVRTSGLGTANYTVYDASGTPVAGLSQSGIVADGNGRFNITPVSAVSLSDLTHYSVKVGIIVDGVERIAYKGFTLLGA